MIRVFVILILFFVGLPSFSGGCDNWQKGIFPDQLLKEYSREYLTEYCSRPTENQNSMIINQFGQYTFEQNGPVLNSKYRPETIIYPFRTKEQQARADYYFEQGLKMRKP